MSRVKALWLAGLAALLRRASVSTLHLAADTPPRVRVEGELRPLDEIPWPEDAPFARPRILTSSEIEELLEELLPADVRPRLERSGDAEFPLELEDGSRAAVCVYRARGAWKLVAHLGPPAA